MINLQKKLFYIFRLVDQFAKKLFYIFRLVDQFAKKKENKQAKYKKGPKKFNKVRFLFFSPAFFSKEKKAAFLRK